MSTEQVRYLVEFGKDYQNQWFFPTKERAEKSALFLFGKTNVRIFELKQLLKANMTEEIERKELKWNGK